MNRRFRRVVAWVVMATHAIAPLAAGARVAPGMGAGDFCSASAAKADAGGGVAGLPTQRTGEHRPSHCALCSGSAGADAILPPPPKAVPQVPETAGSQLRAHLRAHVATRPWLPDARGPPHPA